MKYDSNGITSNDNVILYNYHSYMRVHTLINYIGNYYQPLHCVKTDTVFTKSFHTFEKQKNQDIKIKQIFLFL